MAGTMLDDHAPSLKPGLSSTTFWMTSILSAALLVNGALESYGRQPIRVTPELTTLLAAVLVVVYTSWRHWNRRTVNMAKMEIEVAKAIASAPSANPDI